MADEKKTETATTAQAEAAPRRTILEGKEAEALAKAYRETGEAKPGYAYTFKARGGVSVVQVEKIG